jgi:LacI family kdg operon repressor
VNDFSAAQRSRVTMLDVAEHAKVSKASVSRFIGDDRALLSDAIAQRIEQAIAELGYRPNQMARGLKRGRTRLIGMLVADIRNPYSIAVMHGWKPPAVSTATAWWCATPTATTSRNASTWPCCALTTSKA